MTGAMRVPAVIVASCIYWLLVCRMAEVRESWDAGGYWTVWYPVSLGFAAAAGWWLKDRAWLAGMAVTFAQLPVMWMHNQSGTLWIAALFFLSILAVPAIVVAWIAGGLAKRRAGE